MENDHDPRAERRHMLERLASPNFIAEVRHLCQVDAFVNENGKIDLGWNCRTQALLLALVCTAMDLPSAVAHGRATFVVGAVGDQPPVAVEVHTHAWVLCHGCVDISPYFAHAPFPELRSWETVTIIRNRLSTGGTFRLTVDPGDYEHQVGQAMLRPRSHSVIYECAAVDEITLDTVAGVARIGASPLLDLLSAQFSSSILFAAAKHLLGIAEGTSSSTIALSREEAWRRLERSESSAEVWFLRYLTPEREARKCRNQAFSPGAAE